MTNDKVVLTGDPQEIVLALNSQNVLSLITFSTRGFRMGEAAQLKLIAANSKPGRTIAQLIESRRSKELVIAFCGPVGSGIAGVVE